MAILIDDRSALGFHCILKPKHLYFILLNKKISIFDWSASTFVLSTINHEYIMSVIANNICQHFW